MAGGGVFMNMEFEKLWSVLLVSLSVLRQVGGY